MQLIKYALRASLSPDVSLGRQCNLCDYLQKPSNSRQEFNTRHKGVATLSVAIYKRAALCTQTLDFHYVEPGLEPPFVTPPFSTLISMTLKTKGHMQVVEHSRFLFNLKISIS